MRIGSLLALVVAVAAIAVSSASAVAVPGTYRFPTTTVQRVQGHPLQLAQIGLLTSYHWAQPGCAPVFTPHAQPW